ncbi:hypothetical protein VE02_02861 [Pseudogymnoascus sp. 03VT05]|nr:hypothetical protein VE02_02861 [Pseudogymnoascus sp. 03VT05]
MAAVVELRPALTLIRSGPAVSDLRGAPIGNVKRLHTQRQTCTSIAAIILTTFFLCSLPADRFLDVCDFVVKTTAINITDIDTLEKWLLKPNERSSDPNCAWDFCDYIGLSIRKLNVSFRLPLAFYEALQKDEDEDLVSVAGPQTRAVSVACAAWERLWPAICQLPQLRSLHAWLDHDDVPSWSFVNERVALRPVIGALLARRQARSEEETMPHMDVALNLPKLHPRYAKPDTLLPRESVVTIHYRATISPALALRGRAYS